MKVLPIENSPREKKKESFKDSKPFKEPDGKKKTQTLRKKGEGEGEREQER